MIPETLHDLQIPIDSVTPYPRNPRQGDIGAICESLEAHGQYRPIVVNSRGGTILAGNHTWQAAKALGWDTIAATFVDVDDDTAARIVIIDNRSNDLAAYDDHALSDLLVELVATDRGLSGTGYDGDDLDYLLATLDRNDITEVPEPIQPPPKSCEPGDVWTLDHHRLVCGDASDPDVWTILMMGAGVNLAVTSPPYADRRKYDESSPFRPIPPGKYVDWFAPIAANVHRHLTDDGSWLVNIKAGVTPDGHDTELYVLDLVLAHVREWGWHWATEFCWERFGVPKSPQRRLKNQFEPVYQFTKGRWKFNPDQVRHQSDHAIVPYGTGAGNTAWDGQGDAPGQGSGKPIFASAYKKRTGPDQWMPVGTESTQGQWYNRRGNGHQGPMSDLQGTSVTPGEWIGPGLAYPGNRLPSFANSHTATGHPAAYPIGLPAFFINLFTDPGDTVVDPFLGSGSTILAADQTGRTGYGIEISPEYCDITIHRYLTHKPDAHVTRNGETWTPPSH